MFLRIIVFSSVVAETRVVEGTRVNSLRVRDEPQLVYGGGDNHEKVDWAE